MDGDILTSKQERRTARREERMAEAGRQQRRRLVRRIVLWTVVIAVLAGTVWLMYRAAGTVPQGAAGTLSVPVSAADISQGPASASVTLVEYSDFQCPACAAFNSILKQLQADPEAAGKVRLVYRFFPLRQIHANAQLSAQAAQAAYLQGKFWEMHDLLFENQAAWENLSSSAARDRFIQYATDLKLDIPKFAADLDSSAVAAKIQADYDSGVASGVEGTPTFYINGTKMPQPASYDDFKTKVLAPTHANQ